MARTLRRILCIEDDPDIQQVAQLSLEALGGFEVTLCGSGAEALEVVGRAAPDLILLDVMMPGMDGVETLSRLRALPGLAAVPILFMTAKVQPGEVRRFRDLGAAEIVAKPFDPIALPEQIRGVWERLDA
jgi:CheY-like chemotaxis protein